MFSKVYPLLQQSTVSTIYSLQPKQSKPLVIILERRKRPKTRSLRRKSNHHALHRVCLKNINKTRVSTKVLNKSLGFKSMLIIFIPKYSVSRSHGEHPTRIFL